LFLPCLRPSSVSAVCSGSKGMTRQAPSPGAQEA
jgi:hypothetical protein